MSKRNYTPERIEELRRQVFETCKKAKSDVNFAEITRKILIEMMREAINTSCLNCFYESVDKLLESIVFYKPFREM